MLPSRGFLQSCRAAAGPSISTAPRANSRQLTPPAGACRYLSTTLRRKKPRNQQLIRPGSLGASRPTQLFSVTAGHCRFASTTTPPLSQPDPPAAPDTLSPADEASAPIDDVSSLNLDGSSLLDLPVEIGYLDKLGLDFGWGPTSFLQYLLEHVHVYTGMPWWGSIATVTLLLRLALMKPSLTASEQQRKMADLQRTPRFAAVMQALREGARDPSRRPEMLQLHNEMTLMRRAAGIDMWRMFVPLIQLPLSIAAFRLLRAMSDIPVPGFDDGGVLWFSDLTIPDPFYILPLVTGGSLWALTKMMSRTHTPQQRQISQMMVIMSPLSVIGTAYLPASLQLSIVVAGAFQMFQIWLFYLPQFRQLAGMPPFKDPASARSTLISPYANAASSWQPPRTIDTTSREASAPEAKGSSYFSAVKNTIRSVRDKGVENKAKYAAQSNLRKAQEYEERRALEEEEKMYARRMERINRSKAQRQGEE